MSAPGSKIDLVERIGFAGIDKGRKIAPIQNEIRVPLFAGSKEFCGLFFSPPVLLCMGRPVDVARRENCGDRFVLAAKSTPAGSFRTPLNPPPVHPPSSKTDIRGKETSHYFENCFG